MIFYATFLTALFTSMVLVAGFIRIAKTLGFVDLPDARKVHTMAIPRVGGIGMVLGAVVAFLLWGQVTSETAYFLAGIAVIAVFGIWDDRSDLNYKLKFLGQFLAVLLVVFPGGLQIHKLSLLGDMLLPAWVSIPLTILFLLGVTNAINLADGLDGLASGQSLLSLACVMVLAFPVNDVNLQLMALAMVGGTIGFLRFNTHPAQVFMGDTGSQFLGFGLGVMTLWLTQVSNTALAPELPLLILGLPVIDTLTVMGQRMLNGNSPFKPDKNHFHHKLLALGFDHFEAVVTIYIIQMIFVVSAYALRFELMPVIFGVYFGLAAVIVLAYPLTHKLGWQLHHLMPGQFSSLTRRILSIKENGWLEDAVYYCVSLMIVGFMIVGCYWMEPLPTDVGMFALFVTAVSLVLLAFKFPLAELAQRLAIYTFMIVITYALDDASSQLAGRLNKLEIYFLVLGVLIALGVHLASNTHFAVTPSDYLFMGILFATAVLPVGQEIGFSHLILESAVILYGVEFILRRHRVTSGLIWWGTVLGFSVMGVRGMIS